MEKVILDTSVIVKWFVEEGDSPKAIKFLENYKKGLLEILLPEIAILELTNALFYGAGFNKELLIKTISSFYALNLIFIPLDMSLVIEAIGHIEKNKITAYDALFISLAEKEKVSLITADKKHHQKRFSRWIKYLLD